MIDVSIQNGQLMTALVSCRWYRMVNQWQP